MRWLWGVYSQFAKLFLGAPLVLFTLQVHALDDSRLWLPAKYQGLYLDLKESAVAAESLEKCTQVLRGTLDRDQSTSDHPIFRILCRMSDGRTYNEMVDGLTKETLTTPVVVEEKLTPEELEAIRLEEERRKQEEIAQKKQALWLLCEDAFSKKTALMLEVRKKQDGYIEPVEYSDESATFHIAFDAENLEKTPLKYLATCTIQSSENPNLIIKPRR